MRLYITSTQTNCQTRPQRVPQSWLFKCLHVFMTVVEDIKKLKLLICKDVLFILNRSWSIHYKATMPQSNIGFKLATSFCSVHIKKTVNHHAKSIPETSCQSSDQNHKICPSNSFPGCASKFAARKATARFIPAALPREPQPYPTLVINLPLKLPVHCREVKSQSGPIRFIR